MPSAQQRPGEDRSEVGLHDEGDGEGDPVRAWYRDEGDQGLGQADAEGEAQAVAPGGGGQQDFAGGAGGADAQGGGPAEAVVDVSEGRLAGGPVADDVGGVPQCVVDGARGLVGGDREVESYGAGVAGLDGVGEVAQGVRDRGGQRLVELVGGRGGFDDGRDGVELGEQPGELGAAAVVEGAPGEGEVVGLVEGLGDGEADVDVPVGAGCGEQVGDGPVGVGDGGPFGDARAQRPGEQGEGQHEEAAAGHQHGREPPGPRQRKSGSDGAVEQEQQAGHGGHGADRRDHPGDERDAGDRADGDPAVAEDERADGDADRAEELGDRDVEDAHAVGVRGVADDAGQGAHGGEGPVRGFARREADRQWQGQRDRGAAGGGPGDGGPLRPEVPDQPVGRGENTGQLAGHGPIMTASHHRPGAHLCW